MAIPATMKAVVAVNGELVVKEIPVPKPRADEVLVKVRVVGLNPTDQKHRDYKLYDTSKETVFGCEASGDVVDANGNEGVQVGEQVVAMVSGASTFRPDAGAFAEYMVTKAKLLFKPKGLLTMSKESKVPAGPIKTYQGAVSTGVSLGTVMSAFEYHNKQPLKKDAVKDKDQHYFVWGGSSSLGQIAIQIGKYLGYTVVTTASPKNHELLKQLGADATFDYRDPEVVDKIKAFSGDKLVVAYDTITMDGTTDQVFACMSTKGRAKVNTSLMIPNQDELLKKYPHIDTDFPLAYLNSDDKKQFGVNGAIIPSPPGLHEKAAEAAAHVNNILQNEPDFLRHMPVRVVPGGLEGINAGLDILAKGDYSAEKIALVISEN